MTTSKANKYLAKSSKRLKTAPRAYLGSFASDFELVVKIDATLSCIIDSNGSGKTQTYFDLQKIMLDRLVFLTKDLEFDSPEYNKTHLNAEAEAGMWRRYMELPAFEEEWAHEDGSWSDVVSWSDFMYELAVQPARTRYAEVGIADIAAIDRFVAEGVDPQLGFVMMESAR